MGKFLVLLNFLLFSTLSLSNEIIDYENGDLNFLRSSKNTVVVFGADWCPSCVSFKKLAKKEKHPNIRIIYVDIEKKSFSSSGLKEYKAVKGIPYFVAMNKSRVIFSGNVKNKKTFMVLVNSVKETEISWKSVLVAGSASEEVFDNATKTLGKVLESKKVSSVTLTADPRKMSKFHASGPDNLYTSIAKQKPVLGDNCFFYLTSHGTVGKMIGRSRNFTSFNLEATALQACEGLPTVLALSACFSGSLSPKLQRENLILFTASAADRSSFGCSSDNDLTYYDSCFFQNMKKSKNWKDLSEKIISCVAKKEVAVGIDSDKFSNPTFFQGISTKNLNYFLGE